MSSSEENPTASVEADVWDQLNTEESKAIHKLTDDLSSCGVGKIVNLPQIIVVGQQSAGKSSVLEAITRVRFPVHSGVCTRFATELVLRRDRETSVDVSVRFADHSKGSKAFQRKGFRDEDLPEIIMEARECMGLPPNSREFSKDVLRLEISGPNMFPLTLVDLPGLYQNQTEKQSDQGIVTVNELVQSYIKQTSSIILVVIPASRPLSDNSVFPIVREYDPKFERTIGLITKPDLTKPGRDAEREHIRLARNREATSKLKLGWHVLRNRAEDEDSLEARDAKEAAFFETGAWAALPPSDRGIVSLRKRLSGILLKHIQSDLGRVVDEIEERLMERSEELARLGPVRSDSKERRTFLIDIAQRYHSLAECGVDGRYNHPFFGNLDDTAHKFRAQLRNLNNTFDHLLAVRGSKLSIIPPRDFEDSTPEVPEHLHSFLEVYSRDFPRPKAILLKDLHSRLEKQAASNQGREFAGSPSRDLVIQLFQDQASPWKGIASFHIHQVTLVAKAFVDQIFRHVVGQPEVNLTTEGILRNYVDTFFAEKEEVLNNKLLELLKPFERGYAMPQDLEFQRMVRERTMGRLSTWLASTANESVHGREQANTPQITESLLKDAVLALEGPNHGQFGTAKVIDMMQAYYEMSRRTFTDNVINLAVESCLVADLPDILTPKKVDRMSDEELKELARESDDTLSRRKHLEAEKKILQKGLETCRKHRPRVMTAAPFARSSPSASSGVPPSHSTVRTEQSLGSGTANGDSSLFTPNKSSTIFSKSSGLTSESEASSAGKSPHSGGLFSGSSDKAPHSGGLFGASRNSGSKSVHEVALQSNSTTNIFKPLATSSDGFSSRSTDSTSPGGLFRSPFTNSNKVDHNETQQGKSRGTSSGPSLFNF